MDIAYGIFYNVKESCMNLNARLDLQDKPRASNHGWSLFSEYPDGGEHIMLVYLEQLT
jgi:hypothetical protein